MKEYVCSECCQSFNRRNFCSNQIFSVIASFRHQVQLHQQIVFTQGKLLLSEKFPVDLIQSSS